jgi:hypothetical protein
MAPRKQTSNQTQKEKFIAAARAAGCDESEEAFDAKLKKLMTVKTMTQAQVKKKAKKDKK